VSNENSFERNKIRLAKAWEFASKERKEELILYCMLSATYNTQIARQVTNTNYSENEY
jgi:hypothetical protein